MTALARTPVLPEATHAGALSALRRHCPDAQTRPLCLRLRPFKMSDFYIQSNSSPENIVEHSQIDAVLGAQSFADQLAASPRRRSHKRQAAAHRRPLK
jgi:hypothetical protein